MTSSSPPTARLLPRSVAEHLCAGQRSTLAWCHQVAIDLVHGVMLVAPVVVLAGSVVAMVIAFSAHGQHVSYPMLSPPPSPSPGRLCNLDQPTTRDACWSALFERMRLAPGPPSPGPGGDRP